MHSVLGKGTSFQILLPKITQIFNEKGVFMENKIRVLIAEDLEPIRKKYVYYLSQCADIELVGSVESGKEAVETALSAVPDVILMDIEMETKDAGIRASREILAHYPDIKIIILTVYEDDELIFRPSSWGYATIC